MIAAAFGTAVGNPLTFPAIWAATHGAGTAILGARRPRAIRRRCPSASLLSTARSRRSGIRSSSPCWSAAFRSESCRRAFFYVLTRFAVTAFQHRRRMQFETHKPVAGNPEIGV
jgi:uncharacterized protein (DUF2062 family)